MLSSCPSPSQSVAYPADVSAVASTVLQPEGTEVVRAALGLVELTGR